MNKVTGKILIVLSVLMANMAHAQEPNIEKRMQQLYGSHVEYVTFFYELQKHVEEGDKSAVTSMVSYPILVKIQGKKKKISSQKELLKNYDLIFKPEIKEKIKEQKLQALFANYKGIMIGNGEIWFGGKCLEKLCHTVVVKIIAIN